MDVELEGGTVGTPNALYQDRTYREYLVKSMIY